MPRFDKTVVGHVANYLLRLISRLIKLAYFHPVLNNFLGYVDIDSCLVFVFYLLNKTFMYPCTLLFEHKRDLTYFSFKVRMYEIRYEKSSDSAYTLKRS